MSEDVVYYQVIIGKCWSGNLSREYFDAWLKKGAMGRFMVNGGEYTQQEVGGAFVHWDGSTREIPA